jgi:dienelactone hydrolase
MRRLALAFGLVALFATPAWAAVKGEEVQYRDGNVVMKGYLAYDDAVKGKRPGVIVVHEWWGHNEYTRKRARMLAELGYTALAVDMYGEGKTADHPDTAGKFSGEVRKNMALMTARFNAARQVLIKHKTVDAERVAAIGYCFGGSVVLEMARQGADLAGVVSFHGNLQTEHPAKPGKVKAQLLVLNGGDDPFVSAESIAAFKKEMEAARAKYRFVSYPGAKHAFTNPDADGYGKKFNLPLAYNAVADKESWDQMKVFLAGAFKKK